MDTLDQSLAGRLLTLGAALLLGGLLVIALGALLMGALGFAVPHFCAGW
jgi:hypothetical protein